MQAFSSVFTASSGRFIVDIMSWGRQHSDQWWTGSWNIKDNSWYDSGSSSSGRQSSKSAPPTTPPKKKPDHEELASFQGYSKQDYSFPASFQQKPGFHDAHAVFGLKFPSKILPTAWASQHSFAGRDIREVSLHEVCYKGLDNYHLRSFANGRYLKKIFARSIKESVFSQTGLTAIRESELDLDQTAASFCQQHNITIDKSKSEANIKKLQTQALAEWVAQQLQQFAPPEDPPVSIPQSPSSTWVKAPPTDFLTKALTFDGSPVKRTLATNAPASATPGAINKWIEKLHLDKKVRLQLDRAIKGINKP